MNKGNKFENKHVLITGGARGIGFEIAMQFAREGAQLTIFDNHQKNLLSAIEKLRNDGARVKGEQVDITDRKKIFEAVALTESMAAVDILINNAGIAKETPFLDIGEKKWEDILEINLTGIFRLTLPEKMEDIAPLFLFLASEESSFMTGQVVVIDGGQLAGQKPFNTKQNYPFN